MRRRKATSTAHRRAATVALVLAMQVGVPSYVLVTQERPARFGWHMFATESPVLTATIHLPGQDVPVDPLGYIGRFRPEIDYQLLLPPHLCSQFDGAQFVTVQREGRPPMQARCRS